MRLQESGEMYLETLLVLSKKNPSVRAIDISEHMGYSKPSVSRALGLLKEGGYVISDNDGFLFLTASGRDIAEKTYERHTVLTDFFIMIGIGKNTAAEDACKIEHDISDETFEAIKKYAFNNKNKNNGNYL